MSAIKEEIAAVVIDNLADQQLLARLLTPRKFHIFDQCDWIDTSAVHYHAIIVCHRASPQSPLPCLPLRRHNSRIIVLSDSTNENTVVDTLNAGAHQYFNLRESESVLEARLSAALRSHLQRQCRVLNVEPYLFNVDSRTAYYRDRLLDLSPREFELAYYLFANRSRIVLDSELMTSVWTLPPSLDTRRIDTSICRIKKKMNLNTARSKWKVLRLRRQGYQVCC